MLDDDDDDESTHSLLGAPPDFIATEPPRSTARHAPPLNQHLRPHNGSFEELEAYRKQLVAGPNIVSAAGLLRRSESEAEFLIKQRIPAGAITLIAGAPGSSKSWLAFDLAVTVAQGDRPWLGRPGPSGPQRVLVLSYENRTAEIARRFKRLGLRETDPLSCHSPERDPWRLPSGTERLCDAVHELQPSLIVVDSFRRAIECDENDALELEKVMAGFRSIAACRSKPAIVIIYHLPFGPAVAGGALALGGEPESTADAIITVEDGAVRWTKALSWNADPQQRVSYQLVDVAATTCIVVGKSAK